MDKLPRLNRSWDSQPGLLERNWDTAMTAIEKGGGGGGAGNTTVYIYQRAPATPTPSLPSATATYTFSTATITGLNNGWSGTIPAATSDPLWVSTVNIIAGTDTVNIDPSLWAPAQILAENGAPGPTGPTGSAGTDGAPGAPGDDGLTYYTWIAYADSQSGSVNFTTGAPNDRHFIGISSNNTTSTESSNPSDYTWSAYSGPPTFGLVNGGNVNIAGGKIAKISGTNGSYDASGYSSEAWINACTVSIKAGDLTGGYFAGLNTDPTTSPNQNSIDFAFYFNEVNNRVDVYESGTLKFAGTSGSGWLLTDVFAISYDGREVNYFKNGSIIYTNSSPAAGLRLYVDTSIKILAATVIISGWNAAGTSGADGADGANGYSRAVIQLYQRAASTPTLPSNGPFTYTFATDSISPTPNNGWVRTIPTANGNPLYSTSASAVANATTDTITNAEFSSAIILNSDGTGSANYTVQLYKRGTSAPALPGNCSYDFSTNILSGTLNGWVRSVGLTTGTDPIYTTQATATSATPTGTDTILSSEWAVAGIVAQNGVNGAPGLGTTTITTVGAVTWDGILLDCPTDQGNVFTTAGAYGLPAISGGVSLTCIPSATYGTLTDQFIGLRSVPSGTFNFNTFDLGVLRFVYGGLGPAGAFNVEFWVNNVGAYVAGWNGSYTYGLRYNPTAGTTTATVTNTSGVTTTLTTGSVATGKAAGLEYSVGRKGRITSLAFGAAGKDGSGAADGNPATIVTGGPGATNVPNAISMAAGVSRTIYYEVTYGYGGGGAIATITSVLEYSYDNSTWNTIAGSTQGPLSVSSGVDQTFAGQGVYTNSGATRVVYFRVRTTQTGGTGTAVALPGSFVG